MKSIIIFLVCFIPASAFAIEPFNCRNGAFDRYSEIIPAEIVAKPDEKIYARDDWEGCPEKESCIQKSYLVNKDKVLTAHPEGDWVCIYYLGKKSDLAGWVQKNKIAIEAYERNPEIKSWQGKWASVGGKDANVLNIEALPSGMLHIVGNASWYGGKNSYGGEIIHIGEADFTVKPNGNLVVTEESEDLCQINLQLFGYYLVSTDNNKCGGVNVSFSGIYKRTP